MNKENIKDVIERLRKLTPDKIEMSSFWSRRTSCSCHTNGAAIGFSRFKEIVENCGTAACLAGWMKFWYQDEPYTCAADTLALVGEVLDIRPYVVIPLCYTANWPSITSLRAEYPEWESMYHLNVLIVLLTQLLEGRLEIYGIQVYEQQVDNPNAL